MKPAIVISPEEAKKIVAQDPETRQQLFDLVLGLKDAMIPIFVQDEDESLMPSKLDLVAIIEEEEKKKETEKKKKLKEHQKRFVPHQLCRPPENAFNVERWTGEAWIPDDGEPGLAFSGQWVSPESGNTFPTAWYSGSCNCSFVDEDKCPNRIAANRTVKRYYCSNGHAVGKYIKK